MVRRESAQDLKIILCGDSAVGKSKMVERFLLVARREVLLGVGGWVLNSSSWLQPHFTVFLYVVACTYTTEQNVSSMFPYLMVVVVVVVVGLDVHPTRASMHFPMGASPRKSTIHGRSPPLP